MSSRAERTSGRNPAASAVGGGQDLQDLLSSFQGRSSGEPSPAADPVNQAMIRHFVEAMGDENPVYLDEEAARACGLPGVIAPPAMLQAWIMRGYRASLELERARAAGESAGSPTDELMALLDEAGFTSVVATNCEQDYLRPLFLGDHLSVRSSIESVSGLKQTALGAGHFLTTRMDFTDARGEAVATMHFRILKFRPRQSPRSAVGAMRPRPAITEDSAFFFEGTREGRLLVQSCGSCGKLRHPPAPACPECRSLDWDAVEVSPRGRVLSFVVVHHPQVPAFDYPLVVALVELHEGLRIVADMAGVEPADVAIGMEVEAGFEMIDQEIALPRFRPVGR